MVDYDRSTALVVVDVQNDFADPKGSLYVGEGERVVPLVNRELRPHVRVGDRPMVTEVAVERFIEVASAASIGTQTALRIFTQIVAALQEAPHVTEEDGT